MKKYFLLLITALGVLFMQCREDEHEPISTDTKAPGVIKNIRVDNLPGTAVIRYDLPNEDDLLYIQAEYTLKNGREMKVKASIYVDSLVCEGFGTAEEYDVKLYAVDKAANYGEPIVQKVNPLTPPVKTILNSVEMRNTFGGVNIQWENKTQSPVAVVVMINDTTDSENQYMEAGTIYTEANTGNYNLRGFDIETRDFYCFVKDRWDNYSDTIITSITPLFEVQLDKDKMKEVLLPNDMVMRALWDAGGSRIPKLWDGGNSGDWDRVCGLNGDMPNNYFFTFDLGVTAKLSRFTMFQFLGWNDQYLYEDAQVRSFELFGTTEVDPDGSWDNWKLIGSYEVIKPSGLPTALWNYTDEDKAAAYKGHEFGVPFEMEPVRYIRMKINSVWGSTSWASIGEMDFYGQVESE